MRKLYALALALAMLTSAAVFVGCEQPGTSPDTTGFTVEDAFGNYDVALSEDVTIGAAYTDGTETSAVVPYDVIGSTAVTWTDFSVTYDEAGRRFVVNVLENGNPTTLSIPDSAVVVYNEDNYQVPFSPTATNLESVILEVQLQASASTQVSSGCELVGFATFRVVFTKDGMTGSVRFDTYYVSFASTSTEAYVSCPMYLAEVEGRIRRNEPETSMLPIYVANGALDINKMQKLESVSRQIDFSGTRTESMVAKTQGLVIPKGKVVDLKVRPSL